MDLLIQNPQTNIFRRWERCQGHLQQSPTSTSPDHKQDTSTLLTQIRAASYHRHIGFFLLIMKLTRFHWLIRVASRVSTSRAIVVLLTTEIVAGSYQFAPCKDLCTDPMSRPYISDSTAGQTGVLKEAKGHEWVRAATSINKDSANPVLSKISAIMEPVSFSTFESKVKQTGT
jgi:hypothetical protein